MTTRSAGSEGFRWFIGVVEDREDPLKLGRLRVRVYNVHSESKAAAPTNELPWASVLNTINSASHKKIGISPTGITVGTTVVGFFMDGNDANQPVIMGTLAGIPGNNVQQHDVPEEARGTNKVVKNRVGPEPASPYASKYPYNKVIRTESGHVIEVDDTPSAERIHIFHKSGTYTEVSPNGRKVDKVVNDHIEVILKDQTVYIRGNVNIKVDGTYTVESGGRMRFKAPRIDFN